MGLPTPEISSIDSLFEKNNFYIPTYQRNYSWTKNEVEDFWDDLISLYKSKKDKKDDYHFFGQIVTFSDRGIDDSINQAIVDGQQRLTTSFIFMAVMKNVVNTKLEQYDENSPLPDDLRGDFKAIVRDANRIMGISRRSNKQSLILQEETDDKLNKHFLDVLHNREDSMKDNAKNYNIEPIKNINNAYKILSNKIFDFINQDNIKDVATKVSDILNDIFEDFRTNFQISMISVPNKTDAFTIFETLNTRGKDLETSDIIKTHLMSLANNKQEMDSFKDGWMSMASLFKQKSSDIDKFIKCYWTARQRDCGKNELYRSISKQVNNEASAREFLEDLLKLKDTYKIITSKSKTLMNDIDNDQLADLFMDLNDMGCRLHYPVILAMKYHDMDEYDILQVTYKLISIFMRNRIICEKGTNFVYSGFDRTAQKIWQGKLSTPQSIKEDLNNINSTNLKVETSFSNLKKKVGSKNASTGTVMYLLFKLYQDDTNSVDKRYDDSKDFDGILLHSNAFKNYGFRVINIVRNVGEYDDYVGNLAIIENDLLTNSSNIQDALSNSVLKHNNNIANTMYQQNDEWTIENITQRQDEFKNLVSTIWH